MKRWQTIALGSVAAVAIAGLATMDYVLLHLPGWLAPRVHAFREVTWQAGPPRPTLPAALRPPNIVLIVADDLGFNDISFNGGGVAGGLLKTPNIDALGHDGATFANGYAGNATCAPSRAALLTGRYPTRFGFEFTPTDTRFAKTIAGFKTDWRYKTILDQRAVDKDPPADTKGVPASERTIAELLRAGGYHTVHLGKWHLGGARGMRPEDQGFDESLGFIIGGQMFLPEGDPNVVNAKQDFDPIDKYIWANLPFGVQYNGGERFHPDRYMTDYLTHQAIRTIDANRNRPFFLYLAYNAPHTPLQALKSDYDALAAIPDHRTRVYAAMIRALDRGVGRLTAALKERELENNTLVIFTSDNGGAHYIGLPDINRPYRGWKATFFEGGITVPFFLRWPAKVPPGTRVAGTVSHFDVFATAAAAARLKPPADRIIDGIDLAPFTAKPSPPMPRRTLFWRSGAYRVVRDGDDKLQMLDIPRRSLLYDLAADPTERKDRSRQDPGKARRLAALIARHDAEQSEPAWPSLIRSPIAIDRPLGTKPAARDAFAYWAN